MKNFKTILLPIAFIVIISVNEWWKYGYEKRIESTMVKSNYAIVEKSSSHGSSIWTPWTFIIPPFVDFTFCNRTLLPINDSIIVANIITTTYGENDSNYLILFNTSNQTASEITDENEIKDFFHSKIISQRQWIPISNCKEWFGKIYNWANIIQNGPVSE